jgi:MOSC domain-containing protein YiiM
MFDGRVEGIFVAPAAEAPMARVDAVRAVPGRGLEGDRYFERHGSWSDQDGPQREVTLVEAEALEALAANGIDVTLGDSRRNIVTRDVPLNHLVGCEFTVGDVRLRGVKLCEPCAHLERVSGKPIRAPLVHRGGLNAQILSEGVVRVGDAVRPS